MTTQQTPPPAAHIEAATRLAEALLDDLPPAAIAQRAASGIVLARHQRMTADDLVRALRAVIVMAALAEPPAAPKATPPMFNSNSGADRPLVMPFGKYKDMPMADVPAEYLEWLLSQENLKPSLARYFQKELDRRGVAGLKGGL